MSKTFEGHEKYGSGRYAGLIVSANDAVERPSGGVYHITTVSPPGKAKFLGEICQDAFDKSDFTEIDGEEFTAVSMPLSKSGCHYCPVFDMDDTLLVKDRPLTEEQIQDGALRDPRLINEMSITELGIAALNSVDTIFICTNRVVGDAEDAMRAEVIRTLKSQYTERTGIIPPEVVISFQEKSYSKDRKKNNASDKNWRAMAFLKNDRLVLFQNLQRLVRRVIFLL